MLIDFVDREKDVPAILGIYGEYIDSSITFEYHLPTLEEMAERIRTISSDYPYIVLRNNDGSVVGYAYAHRVFERSAYQFDAEATIYLSKRVSGKGYGRLLYEKLFPILEKMGIRNLYALVTEENGNSISFHEKMGFSRFARFENVGYKCSRWLSVVWLRKVISPFTHPAIPLIPFSSLPEAWCLSLLRGDQE